MCFLRNSIQALLLLALCTIEAAADDAPIALSRILPETVYAEKRPGHVRLNFDFELVNSGTQDATIVYLELRAHAADGQVVVIKHMGGNGLPGPIAMLPDRTIPAGGSLYVFNPFSDIATNADIARLRLRIFHTLGSLEETFDVTPPNTPRLAVPPLAGVSYIYSGNDLFSHHRRVALNSAPAREIGMERITQRFALDLTAVEPTTGDIGQEPYDNMQNWPAYGRQVVAPAEGEVVAVRRDMPDNRMSEAGQPIKPDSYASYGDTASLGNYVMLKVQNVYVLMAHFQMDTVQVAIGDTVKAGTPLGLLGLSGDTVYPHLHMQMQDGMDSLHSKPLPMLFSCAVVGQGGAQQKLTDVAVDTGQFVAACEN